MTTARTVVNVDTALWQVQLGKGPYLRRPSKRVREQLVCPATLKRNSSETGVAERRTIDMEAVTTIMPKATTFKTVMVPSFTSATSGGTGIVIVLVEMAVMLGDGSCVRESVSRDRVKVEETLCVAIGATVCVCDLGEVRERV
jgi:hypothetical protein